MPRGPAGGPPAALGPEGAVPVAAGPIGGAIDIVAARCELGPVGGARVGIGASSLRRGSLGGGTGSCESAA